MRDLPVLELDLDKPESYGNVAEKLSADERRVLANDLIMLIGVDESSMNEWLGKAKGYLEKVKTKGGPKPQTKETEGANEEPAPSTEMVLAAVIQFSARATDALLGEPDLARASEEGGEPLAQWVSSQLRTKDPNWVLDTDPLVIHMAVTGLAWRKRSYDTEDKAFSSHFLPCTDVIINANVRSAERAPRITHQFERYPYEIERSIARKKWINYDPKYDNDDPQAPKKFYEVDAWLDFDGDGMDEPWTVVISRDDMPEVVRIRPRWSRKTVVNSDDALYFNPIRRFYPYRFLPDPEGGFFPIGFGDLLSRTQSSADQLLSAIIDTAKTESENAGIMSGGGFGLPTKIEVQSGRITSVPMDGAPISNRVSMFPVKTVSPGSVATLEKLMALGDRLAGTLNVLDKAPASMTATMAKGIIDTGSQIQSAVHRRVVASLTQELRMFVQMAVAYDAMPDELNAVTPDGVEVTADPQMATEMQRSALAGIYMQLMTDPLTNWKEVRMRLYRVLRLPQPEKLIGEQQAPQATPDEKMKGALGLMKQRTENMKVIGAVAVQLTQALKNMVDAGGGMVDQRMAMLQMAQLEQAVSQLMTEGSNVGNDINGVAQQPGNQGPAQLPAPADGGAGGAVPGGNGGGPADAGAGGGLP